MGGGGEYPINIFEWFDGESLVFDLDSFRSLIMRSN